MAIRRREFDHEAVSTALADGRLEIRTGLSVAREADIVTLAIQPEEGETLPAAAQVSRHADALETYARLSIAGQASEYKLFGLLEDIAERTEIPSSELSLRFGLHWGATLYIGRVLTAGRSEVTALGDEVNEAARIEACATDGRTLAAKSLIERLDRADAHALGIDPSRITYTQLADLDTATDKARRDAPSIAVCEV